MYQQQLYNNILGNDAQEADAVITLKQIVNDYPWFSAAHFFLLKKISPANVDFRKTASLTALHFNNPFYLKFQLQRKFEVIENQHNTPVRSLDSETVENTSKEAKISLKEEMLFEPLHTSDYFASQGIKLSEEAARADKLGRQLKSFTAWLKTMKKIQPEKLPEGNAPIDITVQKLAEISNREEEVVTESMADVYMQQGKLIKAKEIYMKLSLQNPAKSAFFAAKIESLKQN